MPDKLNTYRRKRDFSRSSEPSGTQGKAPETFRYVMHKHAASHDHFDLRLEFEGVFRSWAVPKGPSLQSGEKRLAVEVEDHPLEYGDFEGVIPAGEYGGGTVMLWDRGVWEPSGAPGKDRLDFRLRGEKLFGRWTLVRIRDKKTASRKPGKNWLLIKRTDNDSLASVESPSPNDRSVKSGRTMKQIAKEASGDTTLDSTPVSAGEIAQSRRGKLPAHLPVQLATLAESPPEGDQWLHEIKFDGYRLQAKLIEGKATLLTRNAKDWTRRFPAVREALESLPVKNAIIDGEIVAPQPDGATSFRKLQDYLGSKRLRKVGQVAYQAFDLLFLDDHSLLQTPLAERKEALLALLTSTDRTHIRYSDHVRGQGADFFREVCQLGLEGMVSKQVDARYQQGRQPTWIKTKCTLQEEFVVAGFIPAAGRRRGFRSLLLGTYDRGRLIYAGRVGSGFSSRLLSILHETMTSIEIEQPPFPELPPETEGARWIRPEIVVDVAFSEKTSRGLLRHPVFRGLREDKVAREVQMSTLRQNPGNAWDGDNETVVADVPITHPERVLYPDQGVTKADVAEYFGEIAEWVLPHLRGRPLSLLRCPEGLSGDCFFQKHPDKNFARDVPRVAVPEKQGGKSDFVYVNSVTELVWLVQYGALEFHPWGCQVDDLERPDTLIFDLDPDPNLPWKVIAETARSLRERLSTLGLSSFLQATGGKGLHLIVPVTPKLGWDQLKAFAQAVSRAHVSDSPKVLTTNMAKSKRRGKVFIDYLRNGRGSTSIARYSTRARAGATVATPLRWDELNPSASSNRYTVNNIRRRLSALKADPWEGYHETRSTITRAMLKRFNLE